MNFIVIDKKIEDAIKRALFQLKKEVSLDIYKQIERILLNSISCKRLSIEDVNIVLSLLKNNYIQKNDKDKKEFTLKKYLQKNEEKRKKYKFFDFILYEHLYLVKLLNLYKMKMLCKPKRFQIIKNKGRFLVMANPNACKKFRDSLKVTTSKNNVPKNTNANKNSSGGPGQKGNVGRTKGGNTR